MDSKPNINVVGICSDCSNQRHRDFQKNNPECNLNPGNFVKIAVKDDELVEHMWFIILSVDGDKIVGQLDNEPVLVTNISYGDTYGFAYKNVEQLYK